RHTRFSRDWSSDVCSSDLHFPTVLPILPISIPGFYFLTYQVKDNLAIRRRLEFSIAQVLFPQNSVVVDLSVDGKDQRIVLVGEWLSTRVCIDQSASRRNNLHFWRKRERPTNADNRQTLMAQNGVVANNVSACSK